MNLSRAFQFLIAIMLSAGVATPAIAAPHKETKATKETTVPLAPAPASAAAPSDAAASQTANAAASIPDTSNIMFIQNLRKIGATIYYLGNDQGLNGWFVVKDGQVQILYTTPDQQAVLVGALLSAEGANVSQQQVMILAKNNPDIQKILKTSAAVTGQVPKTDGATVASGQTTNAQAAPVPGAPVIEPATPSEKFFVALTKAANVTFGKEDAPQLLMIMDVNCPHCHRAWSVMQPLVDAGKLRVTMIPIGALGQQSEIEAANWLVKKDPYDAWKKRVAGDDKNFKSELRDPQKEAAVHANTELIQKWGVDQTPYILYYGKNGKVRLVVGEPKSIDEIIKDIK